VIVYICGVTWCENFWTDENAMQNWINATRSYQLLIFGFKAIMEMDGYNVSTSWIRKDDAMSFAFVFCVMNIMNVMINKGGVD
jgi:hypothetical protein